MNYCLAIDIGASSGRHIVGWKEGGRICTDEVYRFPNGVQERDGHLIWDVQALACHVKEGIRKAKGKYPEIKSLSIDTWGVDYVLLKGDEEILPVYAYRDSRTEAVIPQVHEKIPFCELYRHTGCQFQPFNTIYQLYDDKRRGCLNDKEGEIIMIVHNDFIKIQSEARPTFDNVTPQVKEIVAKSGVKNGNVLVYSPHTTCSVVIQEYSDGQTYYGTELIQQDLVNVLNKIIPTCTNEGQYLHPCQKHIEDAARLRGEHASWSLNTDAHLRSVIMGRSVTVPIIDGEVQLGEFGYIWFADFDQVRARERKAIVQVMGI